MERGSSEAVPSKQRRAMCVPGRPLVRPRRSRRDLGPPEGRPRRQRQQRAQPRRQAADRRRRRDGRHRRGGRPGPIRVSVIDDFSGRSLHGCVAQPRSRWGPGQDRRPGAHHIRDADVIRCNGVRLWANSQNARHGRAWHSFIHLCASVVRWDRLSTCSTVLRLGDWRVRTRCRRRFRIYWLSTITEVSANPWRSISARTGFAFLWPPMVLKWIRSLKPRRSI